MRKITYPIFLFLFMISCGGSSNYGTSLLGPGETSILETVQDEALRDHINDMMDDGWMELVLPSSDMHACYEYSNEKGTIENFMEIKVGDGTDLTLRLLDAETNNCIRYVYIRKNDTYKLTNIPLGNYKIKYATGFGWFGKYENNICKGKFVMSPEYHLTEDILEFKLDTIVDGDSRYTEFSTYTYFFNVNSNNTDAKPFDTKSISEEEFND